MEFGSFMEFHTRPGLTQAEAFREGFSHIETAESLGLDSVWMAESHFNPQRSVLSAPLVLGAAIAGRTSRIKIGTAVHVIPLGNPIRMAEEAATLDQVSQGRFEYGVGRSGFPGSYEGYGMVYGESRERFYEYLQIIRGAWTTDNFSFKGDFYSYDDVCLTPKPYQQPHPPFRIAATTTDTFTVLGDLGYPIFVGVRGLGASQVAEQVAQYKQAWDDAGHEGSIDVSLRIPVYVGATESDGVNTPEHSFMKQFRRLGSQLAASVSRAGTDPREERAERSSQLAGLSWDEVKKEKVAVGTPEMVVNQLARLRDQVTLSGVVAEFNAGEEIPPDKIESSLRLFCEEVMPALK
jgi:alkanesulfonate monooxygenase SsuD/methylene tetrahydromethanopterin reductase-like flavin-dependent oxidoreductase (luciferase family)